MSTWSVSLIGMPGSGKSTVGRLLASRLGYRFVDVDQVIIGGTGQTLQQLIDQHGRERFLDIEADYVQTLRQSGQVYAPGGSVIYRPRAMEHLQSLGPVLYLEIPLDELAYRLGDLAARGVVLPPGMTLADLYNQRCPLYQHFCTGVVPCRGLSPAAAADFAAELAQKLAEPSAE